MSALVCRDHNVFLKWLNPDDAEYIAANKLAPVEGWQELTRPKKLKKQRFKKHKVK